MRMHGCLEGQEIAQIMRHGTNIANNLWGFSFEIMRHFLYFLALILTFKVSHQFALSHLPSNSSWMLCPNYRHMLPALKRGSGGGGKTLARRLTTILAMRKSYFSLQTKPFIG